MTGYEEFPFSSLAVLLVACSHLLLVCGIVLVQYLYLKKDKLNKAGSLEKNNKIDHDDPMNLDENYDIRSTDDAEVTQDAVDVGYDSVSESRRWEWSPTPMVTRSRSRINALPATTAAVIQNEADSDGDYPAALMGRGYVLSGSPILTSSPTLTRRSRKRAR